MLSEQLQHLPVIDNAGRLIDIELLNAKIYSEKHCSPVLIMAGGLGERLRPLTNETPKPMLKIGGRPMLENTILSLKSQGFEDFYISVNFKKEKIQRFFGDGKNFGVDIEYLTEREKLGTAGALSLVSKKLSRPLLVLNGDIITTLNFAKLLEFHKESHADMTVAVRDHSFQIPYGVAHNRGSELLSIKEKPVKTVRVNAGVYVFEPRVINELSEPIKIDMPNFINFIIKKGFRGVAFPVSEYWVDIGSFEEFDRANNEYSKHF